MQDIKTKTCKVCGFIGEANKFHGRFCQSCRKAQRKAFYDSNKYRIIENQKEFYQKNKDDIKLQKKEYYKDNKVIILQNHKEYEAHRLQEDITYKLRKDASSLIRQSLKRQNSNKSGKSILQYLFYSIEELKNHLESLFEPWMNWNNWGAYNKDLWNDNDSNTWKWSIDHIIPQSDLPYISMDDENFRKCWALENLRPLNSKQNLIEGTSRTRHGKLNEAK